jgi:hypothetical protein
LSIHRINFLELNSKCCLVIHRNHFKMANDQGVGGGDGSASDECFAFVFLLVLFCLVWWLMLTSRVKGYYFPG